MDKEQQPLRSKVFNAIMFSWSLLTEYLRVLKRYFQLGLLYQRISVIETLAENQEVQLPRPKVLAIIAHVTSVEEAKNRDKAFEKIERLKNTIDGLLTSFAHCELSIVISTVSDRHITEYLPDYQIRSIRVEEELDCDPMFVEFRIQDKLIDKVDKFDWFLFLEDDIVIHDSYFLEKLDKFQRKCGYPHAVLMPNRYEVWEEKKSYIDLTILKKELGTDRIWNGLSIVEIEGVKFAECANPHAGCYCLSQSQLKHWMSSERAWKNKVLGFGGPLECAATFSLLECFSLYKAHASNLHFFEVRHYDTKYSKLYPEPSRYILSGIKDVSQEN